MMLVYVRVDFFLERGLRKRDLGIVEIMGFFVVDRGDFGGYCIRRVPDFGGQYLDTDPNFGRYRPFYGTSINVHTERSPK